MPRRLTSAFASIAILLSAGTAAAADPTYVISFLGSYSNQGDSFGALNEKGWMIGTFSDEFHGTSHGFVLNAPPPITVGLTGASDINNTGVIAGSYNHGEQDLTNYASTWFGGVRTTLAGANSVASRINDAGMVVGLGGRAEGRLWRWNPSLNTYAGIGSLAENTSPDGLALNQNGDVAYSLNGAVHTWANGADGITWDDPTKKHTYQCRGMSDDGWLAANSSGDAAGRQGLLRTPSGTVINLSLLLNSETVITAMSGNGIVLGRSTQQGIFTWSEGAGFTFVTLSTPPGWSRSHLLVDINNYGQIMSAMTTQHDNPVYELNTALLSPAPTPGTSGVLLATFAIGSRRRR